MSTPPIIIKKVKKIVAGHHGGSWKIAYADFLAGMMTFFLLMWLISIMSPKQKSQVAAYFRKFNIFKKAGLSMIMEFYKKGTIQSTSYSGLLPEKIFTLKTTEEKLKKIVETYLKSLKEHILIKVEQRSGKEKVIRIEIVDLLNRPLFLPGSAQLTPQAKKILKAFADALKELPVSITVEGHTDAAPSKTGKIGNWELSTARALSAMLELEKDGLSPNKIYKVVGYADNLPLIKENPYDPRNRRISLVIRYAPSLNSSKNTNKKAKTSS
jgi:chemotaxis protein MotB